MSSLAAASWPEVERSERRVLVVPVGSLEQHGPHLPLDVDTRVAAAVAARVAGSREGVTVAPALPFGASGEHADYPGTVSIGLDALAGVVVELVRDATRHWDAVLIVNGHGGNGAALEDAVSLLAREGRRCLAWSASWPHGDAHAGRTETSLMLALDPASVRLDLAVPGDTRPLDELMPVLRARGLRAVTASGVLGDPTGATAEEGQRVLDALADGCAAALDALLDGLDAEGAGS